MDIYYKIINFKLAIVIKIIIILMGVMQYYHSNMEETMEESEVDFLDHLIERWPFPYVARREIELFCGSVISARTLANLDCMGKGPPGRVTFGKYVCYPTKDLVEWLRSRMENPRRRAIEHEAENIRGRAGSRKVQSVADIRGYRSGNLPNLPDKKGHPNSRAE